METVHAVERRDEGLEADVEWSVSGSVSHYGHTHYRRNLYRALVGFAVVDGSWKVNRMTMLSEEREL